MLKSRRYAFKSYTIVCLAFFVERGAYFLKEKLFANDTLFVSRQIL